MSPLLIILIVLLFVFGGGGLYAGSGPYRSGGLSLGAVVLIFVLLLLFHVL